MKIIMTRYIIIMLFCIFSLFNSEVFAEAQNIFEIPSRTLLTMDFQLLPNEPQPFTNPVTWKLVAYCIVVSDLPQNPLSFTLTKKKGSINNIEFSEGESYFVTAEPGQRFDIVAEGRARVEVLNLGEQPISIQCGKT